MDSASKTNSHNLVNQSNSSNLDAAPRERHLIDFPSVEKQCSSERSLNAKILEDSQTDFTTLRILNRYVPIWQPNCRVRVGEQLFDVDSRFLAKLSPLLAAMITAAEAANKTDTIIHLSEISPEAMEFLISFISGKTDLPDLWQGHDLKVFQEVVSFAVRWQSSKLLAFCDAHAVKCLTQNHHARDTLASGVAALIRIAASVPKICNYVPSELRRHPTLLHKDNLKLTFWATWHRKPLQKLLSALPRFQRAVAERGASVVSDLANKNIRLISTSNNLWPFLNCENPSLDEQGYQLSGGKIGEPQRDNERQYLDCAQRILKGEPLSQVLGAKEETFLVGLLLHSIRQAPINHDFASLTLTLFSYLKNLFTEGNLSRSSAFFLCRLAEQNPVYASLLHEQKLVLEAQQTTFTSLRSHLNDVDISGEEVWNPQLLATRARAASKWTVTDWERTALVNHWQLFCALLIEDHVSFGTIEECHRLLKKRLEEAVLQDDCPEWAQRAHQQLTSLLNVLTWQGETEQVCDHVEVIEGCEAIELSLFHVLLLQGSYMSKFRQYEPKHCIRWTSQNLDQLPIVAHVLENGTLPEDIVLLELDWDSLVADLGFLDFHDLVPMIMKNLCKAVNQDNVADYFNFARNNDVPVLQKACIDVLNTGGFVKIIPHETGPWELKELAGIDRMPLAQKEMVLTLLREHEWDTSIETWHPERNALYSRVLPWVQTARRVGVTTGAMFITAIPLSLLSAWVEVTDIISSHTCKTLTQGLPMGVHILGAVGCTSATLIIMSSVNALAVSGAYFVFKASSRHLNNWADKVIPLPSDRMNWEHLSIRGPEMAQLPRVSAPSFTSQLVYALDEHTQTLDLTRCSDQLTPKDIVWITQNCPHLKELRIGTTKYVFGNDWRPLAKLSKLRKLTVVFSAKRAKDARSINTLDLGVLQPSWPELEEIQVTLETTPSWFSFLHELRRPNSRTHVDVPFFKNCPNQVPLRLTLRTNIGNDDLKKVLGCCHSLRVLECNFLSLLWQDVLVISQNCPQLSELKEADISGEDLVKLAKDCNLTHIESCSSSDLNNEDVQQLVRDRGSQLKVVSGHFPELTSVGHNAFASCAQLEHLALIDSSLIDEEVIQDLLDAPQIHRLSLCMGAGISVETQQRLAQRWLKNICPQMMDELWCELDSILPSTDELLSLLRPFVPLFSFISQVKDSEGLAKVQQNNPRNTSLAFPVGLFFPLLSDEFNALERLRRTTIEHPGMRNWVMKLVHVTGGYPSVVLQLILQRLASSEAFPSLRTEMLRNYLRYLSLSSHTLTHEQIDTFTKQWTQRAKQILERYTDVIRPEVNRILNGTGEQLSNWVARLTQGPEQREALLAELCPMTLQCAKEVNLSLLKAINDTLSSNPRLSENRRKLVETLQVAKRQLRGQEGVIAGLRQRREERLAVLRNVDGTLPAEHERQRLESEGVEEQMVAPLRNRIHQLQEQLAAIEEDSNVDENMIALLFGMFLQPQFWTLVNQTLTGVLNLSPDE